MKSGCTNDNGAIGDVSLLARGVTKEVGVGEVSPPTRGGGGSPTRGSGGLPPETFLKLSLQGGGTRSPQRKNLKIARLQGLF